MQRDVETAVPIENIERDVEESVETEDRRQQLLVAVEPNRGRGNSNPEQPGIEASRYHEESRELCDPASPRVPRKMGYQERVLV